MIENHDAFASTVVPLFLASHEVQLTPSVKTARQLVQSQDNPFDAVVVDYDLVDGMGVEFVEFLRQFDSTTRVIAISAHDFGNRALVQAGADATCKKRDFKRIAELLPPHRGPESRRDGTAD